MRIARPGWRGSRILGLGLMTWIGLSLLYPWAAASQEVDPELEQLRQKIAASRARVVDHEQQERGIVQLIEDVDRGLDALNGQVSRSVAALTGAKKRVAALDEELEVLQNRLSKTQTAMSERVVALYKAGETGPLRLLFASENLRETFAKLWSLERILRSDAELLERFRIQRVELRAARDRALTARTEFQVARQRLTTRQTALEAEKRERSNLLAQVRTSRSRERALLEGLERAAVALQETLEGLQGQQRQGLGPGAGAASHFASSKGRLRAPVDGPVQRSFGRVVDAQYQTTIFRKGVEFAARVGDTVRAVAPGRVRFAGWFRGYGKIVIVDHGGGYFTVSGHLSWIGVQVGDAVGEGQQLGTVGDTGSLEGPALYFEVRRGGVSLDPAQWLTKR